MLLLSILSILVFTSNNTNSIKENKKIINVSILSILYIILILWYTYSPSLINTGIMLYNNNILLTNYSIIIKYLILILAMIYLVVIYSYNNNNKKNNNLISKEYIIIILFNILGITLFMESISLLSIFIGIELQSYSIYLLTTIYNNKKYSYFSSKYGLIYFLLGSLASILILFGLTILYSESGLINLIDINNLLITLPDIRQYNFLLGIYFILIGIFFKLGLAPIHNWLINVYSNIPNYTTLWISIAPKISLLTFLYTFQTIIISSLQNEYQNYIIILMQIIIIISMIVGAVGGLSQFNIKRILAYSALANSGYLLLSIVSNNQLSLFSYQFYLLQYSLTHILIFSSIIFITIYYENWIINKRININLSDKILTNYNNNIYITDLYDLLRQNKSISFIIIVCMSSFIGIPPLIGFYGKFFILISALLSNLWLCTLILIIVSLITAYYYAYIIKSLFNEDSNITKNNTIIMTNKPNIVLSYILSILSLIILFPFIYMDIYQNGIMIVNYLSNI